MMPDNCGDSSRPDLPVPERPEAHRLSLFILGNDNEIRTPVQRRKALLPKGWRSIMVSSYGNGRGWPRKMLRITRAPLTRHLRFGQRMKTFCIAAVDEFHVGGIRLDHLAEGRKRVLRQRTDGKGFRHFRLFTLGMDMAQRTKLRVELGHGAAGGNPQRLGIEIREILKYVIAKIDKSGQAKIGMIRSKFRVPFEDIGSRLSDNHQVHADGTLLDDIA